LRDRAAGGGGGSCASATSLTILAGGTLRDVPESHVAKKQRPERQIGRGALIGLAAGIGVGLTAGRSSEPSGDRLVDTQAAAGNVAAGMLLGTAAGVIIGAVVKVNRTVYVAAIPPALQTRFTSSKPTIRRASSCNGFVDSPANGKSADGCVLAAADVEAFKRRRF
jgi:hypothetical protein